MTTEDVAIAQWVHDQVRYDSQRLTPAKTVANNLRKRHSDDNCWKVRRKLQTTTDRGGVPVGRPVKQITWCAGRRRRCSAWRRRSSATRRSAPRSETSSSEWSSSTRIAAEIWRGRPVKAALSHWLQLNNYTVSQKQQASAVWMADAVSPRCQQQYALQATRPSALLRKARPDNYALVTDEQTKRQTNIRTSPLHKSLTRTNNNKNCPITITLVHLLLRLQVINRWFN